MVRTAPGVEGAVKNYGADKAYPIERFAADLGKIMDGKDVLYYRFAADNELDRTLLGYFTEQRVRRLKSLSSAHDQGPDDHYRRDAAS